MKKVLLVETNVTRYQGTTDPTGLWLGEAAEFVDEMNQAGIAVDYVSPKGGFVPLDPRSMKYTDDAIMRIYEDPDFIERALKNTLRPDQVTPGDYAAIYYTGGHGVMWDFPDDPNLQRLAMAIYDNGGYISSVCHGIAGLLNLKDAQGKYLIAGKQITGFTTAEERIAGKKSVVPFLNQQVAEAHGAHFMKKRFYSEYAVKDGRVLTGQNPFSVRAVAKLLLNELQH
ncbi:type 1 glutamine amidotransferase domain-containing protein [Lactiplantibacillus paraxiangfangensis]|uniref:type 1 glutamine amidotransferase domain-containing protein n=1 Tax=Lactiplantibacillus paraxiangfangensis TaxID=3076224 RepID=UPI0030C74D10